MTTTKTIVTIPVTLNIAEQRVKDLLCNAIEGGSNYWVSTLDRQGGITRQQAEYRQDVPFVEGGWLELEEQAQSGGNKTFKIDRAAIIKGLAVMAEKYPRLFGEFISENDDADTGDVFLQCICFGEVIYG